MDEARRKLIASMGGKAAHQMGRAHQWNKETAREAGSKGGRRSAAKRAAAKVALAVAATAPIMTTIDEEVSI